MYQQYRPPNLYGIPPVVKNLVIINVLFFIATYALANRGIDLYYYLGLYSPLSGNFKTFQLITHMFMHVDFSHLGFNMLGLVFLGSSIEVLWGWKRFLGYYFFTGFGAALFYVLVKYLMIYRLSHQISVDEFNFILTNGTDLYNNSKNYVDTTYAQINTLINTCTVGASGAGFGILLAFGMLFPNTELMMFFVPFPIKAKYLVVGLAVLEIFLEFGKFKGDNVGHLAHLGGMLFGYILIKYWNKTNRKTLY
jgi:membrane associated rhomboid family serine protease